MRNGYLVEGGRQGCSVDVLHLVVAVVIGWDVIVLYQTANIFHNGITRY